MGDALYSALVFATRWFITRNVSTIDASFGTQDTSYTMMRETIDFWLCYLTWNPERQQLDIMNDCVGELCSDDPWHVHVNPSFTVSALHFVIGDLLDISRLTSRDQHMLPKWKTVLCTLAPYATKMLDGVNITAARDGSNDIVLAIPIFPGGRVP